MSAKRYIPIIVFVLMVIGILMLYLAKTQDWNYINAVVREEVDEEEASYMTARESYTLHVHVSMNSQHFATLDRLRKEVQSMYPQFHVYLYNHETEQSSYSQWREKYHVSELGDVQLLPNRWVSSLAASGYLKPVDSLIKQDTLADQFVALMEALKWNNYIWGLPYDLNPYFILTHVDAPIVASEVDVEQWMEWYLHQQSESQQRQIGPILQLSNDSFESMMIWLSTIDNEWNMLENDKLTPKQSDMIQSMVLNQSISELGMQYEESDLSTLPSYIVTTWEQYEAMDTDIKSFYSNQPFVMPLPWLNGQSFVVSSSSKNADAAAKWIERITELAAKEAIEQSALPVRESSYQMIKMDNRGRSNLLSNIQEKLRIQLPESEKPRSSPELMLKWEYQQQKWNQAHEIPQKISDALLQ